MTKGDKGQAWTPALPAGLLVRGWSLPDNVTVIFGLEWSSLRATRLRAACWQRPYGSQPRRRVLAQLHGWIVTGLLMRMSACIGAGSAFPMAQPLTAIVCKGRAVCSWPAQEALASPPACGAHRVPEPKESYGL